MKTRKHYITKIPHIVWMLWVDFNKLHIDNSHIATLPNSDLKSLKIDPSISRYFEKAIKVNKNWQINIIGNADLLKYYLTTGLADKLGADNINWAIDYINDPNISAQKKSEVIRVILLKYYGGVWIDASTFLISSLDWLDTLHADFICPYVHIDQYVQFSIPPITHYSDKLVTTNYDKWLENHLFKTIQWGSFAKYAPFVPEDWFLASVPHHPIIVDTVRMLQNKSNDIINKSLTKEEIENIYAKYNMELLYGKDKLFTLPGLSFEDPMMLNLFWEIGYLSQYTELYYSLKKFMRHSNHHLKYTSGNLKKSIGKYGFTRRFYKSKCTIRNMRLRQDSTFNNCSDVIITSPTKGSVYLFSASFMRYFKWADTANERSASAGSLIEKLLKDNKSKKEIINYLINNRQYFIKFGAWTRDSPLLDSIFNHL